MMERKPQTTTRAVLDAAADRLRAAGIEPARREAEWLIEHVTGRSRLDLMTHPDAGVEAEVCERLESLLQRRLTREPLQYLTGEAGFFGHVFLVTPDVLIPRPETELLVEWILGRESLDHGVLDLGTGSGCIPVSVRLARPDVACTAVDVDGKALAVARENAARLGADIRFVEADMLDGGLADRLAGPFSVVVSNPPYIGREEQSSLQPEVVEHEPHRALFAEGDALRFYRHLAHAAVDLLVDGGWICLEIHADRGAEVVALLQESGWEGVRLHQDLAGRDRMVCARRGP